MCSGPRSCIQNIEGISGSPLSGAATAMTIAMCAAATSRAKAACNPSARRHPMPSAVQPRVTRQISMVSGIQAR
jgi:hypothetical protein